MNRNNIKQAIQLAEMLNNGNSYTKADIYMQLLKLSRKLSNIDVHYCNGTKYCESEHAYTVATEKVYQKINEVLKGTLLKFYHQSDPRGVALYIGDSTINQQNYTNNLAIY